MAIAFGAIGAKGAGQGTVVVPHPSAVASGDLLVTGVCSWQNPDDVVGDEPGWVNAGSHHGGTGALADQHTTSIRGFTRVATGSEPTSVTFESPTVDTNDGLIGVMLRYTKGAGDWSIANAGGEQAAHQANRVVTFTTPLDVSIGDRLVALVAVERDNSLGITGASFAGTATFGTATMRSDGLNGTALGRDGNVEVFDAAVTANGTCTGFTMLATTSTCGPVNVVRLREVSLTSGTGTFTGTTTTTGAMVGDAPVTGTPVLSRRMVGPTGLIRTVSTNTTSARIKIGTNAAVTTGIVYSTPVAVNPDNGRALHDTTDLGLTPGARYYFRVEMTGSETAEDAGTVGRFRVTPTAAASFSFAFGSCTDYSMLPGGQADSLALEAIAALDDDLFLHLGDLYYHPAEPGPTDADTYRTFMGGQLDTTAHAAIFSTRGSTYTPSDHDYGMQNDSTGIGNPAAAVSFNTVYREMWPAPVPSNGVYYAFTYGRVLFLHLDGRTFKSQPGSTDGAGKTVLGATQKQWLKDQITATNAALIVLVQDVPWIGPPETSDDSWTSYSTERTELANYFAASGKNIVMLAGDMHAAAYDDGTNSPGGIPVLHASPFLTTASRKGGPYSIGPFPAAGAAVSQQYGHVSIDDNGARIVMTFEARTGTGTVLLSATETFGTSGGSFGGTTSVAGAATGQRGSTGTFVGETAATGGMSGLAPDTTLGVGAFGGTTTAAGLASGARSSAGSFAGTSTAVGVLRSVAAGRNVTVLSIETRTRPFAVESRQRQITFEERP